MSRSICRIPVVLMVGTGLALSHGSGVEGRAHERLWLVAPAGGASPFDRTTSLADLEQAFGARNVRVAEVSGGEYGNVRGALLFPGDPMRRLEVVWADPESHTTLERVSVRGHRTRWAVAPGITLGTPLEELQRLNGRPFSFLGFGFDGSGRVQSWRVGRLPAVLDTGARRVDLRLTPSRDAPQVEATMGDRLLTSDRPALSSQGIHVWEITVFFEGE